MLTNWLLNEYILSDTAVGSPYIDGLFIDDFWCSKIINGSKSCTDPVQGPSEVDKFNQVDMGLSDQDVAAITKGWLYNMEIVQQEILKARGYTWSLIPGQDNANAQPILVNATNCKSYMQTACVKNNGYLLAPLLSGLSYNTTLNEFPFLHQQVASFLLMRGPHAFLGFGEWGMEWPENVPFPDLVWKKDFGVPIDETCSGLGFENIYQRRYSKATVKIDCDNWTASFQPTTP